MEQRRQISVSCQAEGAESCGRIVRKEEFEEALLNKGEFH